jgi:hypothetical protein
MNPETASPRPVWHIGLGFVIASFLFAALVLWVKAAVSVPAIDADRAALIARDLAEIRATEAQDLNHPGWIDQQRGIVRLPIDVAVTLAVQEWQNPAVARSNLIAREEAATKPLPKPAAKPNPFE